MNHTTNYNLPQWEDTDAVRREDVNAAMSTIDAAIAGAGGAKLIRDVTLTVAINTFSLAAGYLDWSKWNTVHLLFKPVFVSSASAEQRKYGMTCTASSSNLFVTGISGMCHLLLNVCRDPALPGGGILWQSSGGQFINLGVTYADSCGLWFHNPSINFLPGSRLTAWGQA